MDAPVSQGALVEDAIIDGRYRLSRLLGRGAAGSVWLATHLALSSEVAIKFLDQVAKQLPDDADLELYVARFRFEAQVTARLAGATRHIVAANDAGMHQGIPFLVMEYAPGRTLEEVLAEVGRLPDAEVEGIATQIGEALGAAHALGIVHRDVKAANILCVEKPGQPTVYKLADFGLARVTGERPIDLPVPKRTAEGLIVGTPAYMSPEQIAAEGRYGAPTDLWALGVVLFEALTGRLPFDGSSLTELALAISSRRHPSLASVGAAMSPALDAFFARALAKAPEARFASAAEMVPAFRDALNAQESSPTPIVLEGTPRRTSFAVLGLVVGLALLLGGALFLVRARAASVPSELPPPPVEARALEAPSTQPESPTEPEIVPGPKASATVVATTHGVPSRIHAATPAPSSATPAPSAPPPPSTSLPSTPPEPAAEPSAPPATLHRAPIDKSEIQ